MSALLGSMLLSLLGAPPVFVDDRADIPWIVVATPGARCGTIRSAEGPRPKKAQLITAVARQPEQQPGPDPTARATMRLPLLPSPGLTGWEGEVVVVAVEHQLAQQAIAGPVRVYVEGSLAWIEVPALPPRAEAALAAAAFSAAELKSFQELATARLARRRATIGAWAKERAWRWGCFAVVDDPAPPLDLGRRLRARLAAPLLR